MMSQNATLEFLCGECNQKTSIVQDVQIGDNTANFICACGERWYVLFEVTSLAPLHVGTMLTKRVIGVEREEQ